MNVNPDTEDMSYRYKMPKLQVRLGGRGNGSYTFLDNIEEVAEAINTPASIILNFITRSIGSNYNLDKKTITGHYKFDIIIEQIYNYIKFFVMCKKCSIPEVIPIVSGMKKKKKLEFKCSACGEQYILTSDSKLYDKTLDNIIKNIHEYKIKKGNLVESNNSKDLFNPF